MVTQEVFVDKLQLYHRFLHSIRYFTRVEFLFGLNNLDVKAKILNPNSPKRINPFLRIANHLYILLVWGGMLAGFLVWMRLLGTNGDLGGSLANVNTVASSIAFGVSFFAVLCLRVAWYFQGEAYARAWIHLYNSPNLCLLEGIQMPYFKPFILFVIHALTGNILVVREALKRPTIEGQNEFNVLIIIGLCITSILSTYVMIAGKILMCFIYHVGTEQIHNLEKFISTSIHGVGINRVKILFFAIQETCKNFHKVFSPLLVITLTSDLVSLISCLYFGIIRIIGPEAPDASVVTKVLAFITPWSQSIVCILELIWLCEEGQKFQDAQENFREEVCRWSTLNLDEKAKGELALFTTQLNGKIGPASAGGFFNVNRGLWIGILSSTTTYLVVLLQSYVSVQSTISDHFNATK